MQKDRTIKACNKTFERNGLFVFAFSTAASLMNYLFLILAGRLLSTEDYGSLNSAMSILNVSVVLGTAISISVAKYCAENKSGCWNAVKAVARRALCCFPLVMFVVFVAARFMLGYETGTAALISLTACFICVPPVLYGYLQGKMLLLKVNIYTLIQPGIKLFFGILLIFLGFTYRGAFGAMCVGAVLASLYCICAIRGEGERLSARENRPEAAKILNYSLFCLMSSACLVVFNNIDILLVRLFFSETVAGLYGPAALFGTVILFFPAAFVTVMIPSVAGGGKESGKVLGKTLIYSFLLSALAAIGLIASRKYIVLALFGERYLPALQYVVPVCIMMLPLVLVTVMVNYLLAKGDKKFVSVTTGIAVLLAATITLLAHPSPTFVVVTLSVVYGALFVALFARAVWKRASPPRT